ncbi:uncharacterized protein LOC134209312 [Armigeres subalbatus]|uniref:uncharacterized protein LOC134209312 n=1 Tax=Armigeres subalbatus TaxID=124917 RepID=UPI002ED09F92
MGSGPKLDANSIWFKGPLFLQLPEEEWPAQRILSSPTEEELRPCYALGVFYVPGPLVKLERFSQLDRAIRAVAYVFRYLHNLKRNISREERLVGPLTSEELQKAESLLIREAQWQGFPDEIMVLKRNASKPVDEQTSLMKSSSIYQLCPFLDERNILRVDGRISAAPNVDNNTKFPVILPRKHPLTALILDRYHRRYLHGNTETVVNEIRQLYHVPRLRTAVTKTAKACQWCRVYKSSPKVPRMAPLPLARMASFVRPFTHTGLDFWAIDSEDRKEQR